MKVVEGQLRLWGMVSELSQVSDSFASKSIRSFIQSQVEEQALWPDVLPSTVSVDPMVNESGKIVSKIS